MPFVDKRLKLTLRTGTMQLDGELTGQVASEQTWMNLQKGLHGVLGFRTEELPPGEPVDAALEQFAPSLVEQVHELRARVDELESFRAGLVSRAEDEERSNIIKSTIDKS